MSEPPDFESEFRQILDSVALGEPVSGPFAQVVSDLHTSFAQTDPPAVGAELGQFVDSSLFAPINLSSQPHVLLDAGPGEIDLTVSSNKSSRKKLASAFVGTVVGKIVLGATLAAAATTGAHIAGAVDVPILPAFDRPAVLDHENDEPPEPPTTVGQPVSSQEQTQDQEEPAQQESPSPATSVQPNDPDNPDHDVDSEVDVDGDRDEDNETEGQNDAADDTADNDEDENEPAVSDDEQEPDDDGVDASDQKQDTDGSDDDDEPDASDDEHDSDDDDDESDASDDEHDSGEGEGEGE